MVIFNSHLTIRWQYIYNSAAMHLQRIQPGIQPVTGRYRPLQAVYS